MATHRPFKPEDAGSTPATPTPCRHRNPGNGIQHRQTNAGCRWVVRWTDPHTRTPQSRSFTDPTAAKRYHTRLAHDIHTGDYIHPDAGATTVNELAERWLTLKTTRAPSTQKAYRSWLDNHILPRIGSRPVASIVPSDVKKIVAQMASAGLAAGTITNALDPLRQILDLAVDDRLIRVSPMPANRKLDLPRQAKREFVLLTMDEVDRLAAAAAEVGRAEDGVLVWFLAHTGCRWGEATCLQVRDVDLLRGTVTVSKGFDRAGNVRPTKTYETRVIPLAAWLVDKLRDHTAGSAAEGLLFTSAKGGRLNQSNWRRQVWLPAKAKAKIDPDMVVHDLRHVAASWLVNVSDVKSAMKILGHESLETTARYLHESPESMRLAVERLAELRGNGDEGPGTLAKVVPM